MRHAPFLVDMLRARLARDADMQQLRDTYLPGNCAELPEMSSAKLWNSLSGYEDVPEVRLRRLARVAELLPDEGRILDIGVGWGEIIPLLSGKKGRKYVGLDFSEAMIDQVRKKFPEVELIHGDISHLPGSFDVIMALEVCEHIVAHKVMEFYRQIAERLSNGGIFVVTVPLHEDLKGMTLCCPGCGTWHNRMGHVRSYTPKLIESELRLAGFSILSMDFIYAHFPSGVLGALKRHVVDVGRKLLGFGATSPLNAIVVASRNADA